MCHVLQVVAQAVDHLGPLRSENEIQYLTPQVFYTAQEGGMIKFFFFMVVKFTFLNYCFQNV